MSIAVFKEPKNPMTRLYWILIILLMPSFALAACRSAEPIPTPIPATLPPEPARLRQTEVETPLPTQLPIEAPKPTEAIQTISDEPVTIT
jgi:hypothetical protein